jgi:putative tricarboxylic transport membrane protein
VTSGDPSASAAANRRPGEILVALGVFALGLFYLFGARSITVLPSYARIGPRFFPYIVGAGLVIAGVLLLIDARRGRSSIIRDVRENWRAAGWIAIGLVLNVGLMEWAGYIPATTLLFFFAARGLGSRNYFAGALIGLTLSVVTYLAFTRLLDLKLPPGWLEFALS